MNERKIFHLFDQKDTLMRGIHLDGSRPRIQNYEGRGPNVDTILPTQRGGTGDTFVALEIIKDNPDATDKDRCTGYRLRYQPVVSEKSRKQIQEFLSCLEGKTYDESLSGIIREAYPECVYSEADGFKFGADEYSTYLTIGKNGNPGINPAIIIPGIDVRGGWNDVPGIDFRYKLGYSEKYTSFEYRSGISYREDDYSLSLVTFTGVLVDNLMLNRLDKNTKAQVEGMYWDDGYASLAIKPYIRAVIE